MFIQTEETPNPNTVKFLPGSDVTGQGVAEFKNADEAQENRLATQLFKLEPVTRVFYGADFISVTKAEDAPWDTLKTQIMAVNGCPFVQPIEPSS